MFKSSFLVIFCIGLLIQYGDCNRNAWWKNLMTNSEARQSNQWTTISNERDIAAQPTNRSIKRSNLLVNNEDVTDAPVRESSKSWDKSYARRQTYKSEWADDQPLVERYVETEWDDDMPVRHVFRDTSSSVDEENIDRKSDHQQYERVFESYRDDWNDKVDNDEVVRPVKEVFMSARNTNNDNNNNKNKPKAVTNSWDSRSQKPKPERVVKIQIEGFEEDKKAANEKWNKLALKIFNDHDNKNNNKNNNNNNNKRNEKQSFKDTGDEYVKPAKPKFTVVFETTTPKPEKISAKLKTDDKKINVKKTDQIHQNSGQASSQRFGWRSSVNHGNTDERTTTIPKTTTINHGNSAERLSTKPRTTTTLSSTKPRTTTLSFTDTTTMQPTVTFISTTRAKPKAPKPSTNALTESLAPNKKQHRIGNWVDSESLTFNDNDQEEDDWSGSTIRSQPLIEEEYEDEQLPERIEAVTQQSMQSSAQSSAQQSARQLEGGSGVDYDEPKNWRLEDALPGSPGTDYPIYSSVPKTSFDCKNHEWPGYYADVEAQCQVFHICQTGGRKNSFLCPNGTVFNQRVFVCDWWHNVDCNTQSDHFSLNANIYDYNWESKRTQPAQANREIRRTGTVAEVEPLTPTRNIETTTQASEDDPEPRESAEIQDTTEKSDKSESSREASEEESEEKSKSSRLRSPVNRYKTRFSAHSSRNKRGEYLNN